MEVVVYYDMHCHLGEFSDAEVEQIMRSLPGLRVVAVSEDLRSFNRVMDLAQRYQGRVIPCAGFHPWSLRDHPIDEAWQLLRLAERTGLSCIGEVGLDRRFLPDETFSVQKRVFEAYARSAKELNALLNVHAPGAWREALAAMVELDVDRAMFHWYTGPSDLIGEIVGRGYLVSINAAAKAQSKSVEVARLTPLESMVLESDGPYNYHGLRLTPLMIPELAELVAQVKGKPVTEVLKVVNENSERAIRPRNSHRQR